MTDLRQEPTGLFIEPLGKSHIHLSFCFPGAKSAVLTAIPKRQARAIANRILHELDHAAGKRARRPGSPHIIYDVAVKFSPEYLTSIGVDSKQ